MLRMAVRMVLDDPLKSLGTLVGVVIAVLLMAQQLSILLGILSRTTALIDRSEADIWIASAATEGTEATSNVPEQRVQQAAGVEGVLWAAPVIMSGAEVTKPTGVKELVRVYGVEPPLLAGLPSTLHETTRREDLGAPGRIFIDWSDWKAFGYPRQGDRIEISGKVAVIAGFTRGMLPFGANNIFTNIQDARGYAGGYPKDRVTFVLVKAAPGQDPVVVRDRLRQRVPDVIVVTKQELHDMNIRQFLRRTPVGFVFGLGTLLAALIGAIIVTVTLFSAVVDRTREYATLKALGATARDLRRLLLTQALVFAAMGYVIGLGLFALLRLALSGTPLVLVTPPWVLGLIAMVTVLVCTSASILAIRRVLKLEPALVFRG